MTKGRPKTVLNAHESQKDIFLVAYGSLRRGQYNYKHYIEVYGEDNFSWECTTEITGYKMYDLGVYPAIVPVMDELTIDRDGVLSLDNHAVIVDVFRISTKVLKRIHSMETGAGYKFGTVTIPSLQRNGKSQMGILYYMSELYPVVKDGDWVKYEERTVYADESDTAATV